MHYKNATQKRFYFGYGSNLTHHQMITRCPHSRFIGPGKINHYRLIFSSYSPRWKGGTAGIISDSGASVWGAIYELDAHCVRKLNIFEGMRFHEFHHKKLTCDSNGKTFPVFTYVRRKLLRAERRPSERYLQQIVHSGEESRLPQAYLDSVVSYAHKLAK